LPPKGKKKAKKKGEGKGETHELYPPEGEESLKGRKDPVKQNEALRQEPVSKGERGRNAQKGGGKGKKKNHRVNSILSSKSSGVRRKEGERGGGEPRKRRSIRFLCRSIGRRGEGRV